MTLSFLSPLWQEVSIFSITDKPIDTQFELDSIKDLSLGGIVLFEGRVRNNNEGKIVQALDYEIYPSMALSEGEKVTSQALCEFDIKYVKCIHRYGELKLGDIAVLVIAGSKHRRESFLACEFVIDRVKQTVPVWKKEHYKNSPSEWVACHRCQGDHVL